MAELAEVADMVAIVGAGPVGAGLARLLIEQGQPVVGIASRRPAAALAAASWAGCTALPSIDAAVSLATWVFLAIPDEAIPTLAASLQPHSKLRVVAHLSGALPSAVLRQAGATHQVVSMHPVASLPTPELAWTRMRTCCYGLEGDTEPLLQAERWVHAWGGESLRINPESKSLYHAGACMAANYVCTLLASATALWASAGVPPEAAQRALLMLSQGTLDNIAVVGVADALTGPIRRGDVQTVARHLAALREQEPNLSALYRTLGLYTLRLAPHPQIEALLKESNG